MYIQQEMSALEKYNACSLWLEQYNSQSTKKSYASTFPGISALQ